VSGLARFQSQNHPQQLAKRAFLALPRLFEHESLEFGNTTDDVDDCGTPWDLFDVLNAEFHFTIDVASSHHNTKLHRHFTREDDGLAQSWNNERVWCNPPYSDLRTWVKKAWDESDETQLIVMLLPSNRTEQPWWHELVEPFRDLPDRKNYFTTRFIRGRVKFVKPGDVKPRPDSRPPFGSVLLIWEGGEAMTNTKSDVA